ncbi:MAG: hypothetical protein K6F92_01075 [Lachnospiraceae bacterium]|nr:hypothetical protein [Lachnospiraceae bacterium]
MKKSKLNLLIAGVMLLTGCSYLENIETPDIPIIMDEPWEWTQAPTEEPTTVCEPTTLAPTEPQTTVEETTQNPADRYDLTAFEGEYYYYYNLLSESQKVIYCQMLETVMEKQHQFTPAIIIVKDQLVEVRDALMCDHPEIFWYDGDVKYSFEQGSYKVSGVELTYNDLLERSDIYTSGIEQIRDSVLSNIEGLDIYAREKYIHDYLAYNVDYEENRHDQNIYSALIEGRSVCSGYSKAFQYLCQAAQIPCYLCNGVGYGSEEDVEGGLHMWNVVYMGGVYSNVDITWDDNYFGASSDVNYVSYNYYNVSDSVLSADHERTGTGLKMAACTSDDIDYESLYGRPWQVDALMFMGVPLENIVYDNEEYNRAVYNAMISVGKGEGVVYLGIVGRELNDSLELYFTDAVNHRDLFDAWNSALGGVNKYYTGGYEINIGDDYYYYVLEFFTE